MLPGLLIASVPPIFFGVAAGTLIDASSTRLTHQAAHKAFMPALVILIGFRLAKLAPWYEMSRELLQPYPSRGHRTPGYCGVAFVP